MPSLKNVSVALSYENTGDRILQHDHINKSSSSSDASYCSDSSHVKGIVNSEDNQALMFPWSDDYQNCPSFCNFSHDMFLSFFYRLSELPSELQCEAVKDLKVLLEDDDETCYAMLSNGFAKALLKFLKNSKDQSNVQRQKIGLHILLSFLSNSRVEISSLSEDAFQFLTSLLDSEITTEALMIMQKLSHHTSFLSYIEVSGVPPALVKILDSEDTEFLELSVKILYDLSFHNEIKYHISALGCIPRLVLLLSERSLLKFCINIIRNLYDGEEAARMIAETDGCLASIAEVLETGTHKEQEHVVAILHSLCSRSVEYSRLIWKECVIPSLVYISVNGNPRGKEISTKLLHVLRDLRCSDR